MPRKHRGFESHALFDKVAIRIQTVVKIAIRLQTVVKIAIRLRTVVKIAIRLQTVVKYSFTTGIESPIGLFLMGLLLL